MRGNLGTRAALTALLWGSVTIAPSWAGTATTPTQAPTPTATPPIAGDCDRDLDTTVAELERCVNQFLGSDCEQCDTCWECDVDGNGAVDADELRAAVSCALDPEGAACPRAAIYDGLCGDGMMQGSEACDDGNNYGGDGCAANCTLEADTLLNFGDQASTQSSTVVQTVAFGITLPITGSQILTVGKQRARAVARADGMPPFHEGDLPFVGLTERNRARIDPIPVPGFACACLRGVSLQACGGRPVVPGDRSEICTLDVYENIDPTVCPAFDPCMPVFGPGASLAGTIGCNGATDLDYYFAADSITGATTFARSGGPVELGGTALTFIALGLIADSGTCSFDPSDPRKGPDGLPCTDDDALEVQGEPAVTLLTTGTARGAVLNADSQVGRNIDSNSTCGTTTCTTSATGQPQSCHDLIAGDTAGICFAGTFALLSQPAAGDLVVPTRFCGVP